jgi:hypothetical protein
MTSTRKNFTNNNKILKYNNKIIKSKPHHYNYAYQKNLTEEIADSVFINRTRKACK